jgi:LysR family nitrogen assimilation transcriptional regulator
MEFRQITDFAAVVRCSSFAAASRDLQVSQPGLGYQIKQLEQELRVQLLGRHTRGVSLTPAGETFLKHAQTIIAAIDNAKQAMAEIARDRHRELTIGLSPSAAPVLGSLLLEAQHDNLRLSLREAFSQDIHDGVACGSLDFGVGLTPPSPLRGVLLYREPLFLIGPSSKAADVPLAKLGQYPLVLGLKGHTPRRSLERAAAAGGVQLNIVQEVGISSLRRNLVLREGRFTVAAYAMFAEEIETGVLGACRIVDPEITHDVHAFYAPSLPVETANMLIALVRDAVKAAPIAARHLGRDAVTKKAG